MTNKIKTVFTMMVLGCLGIFCALNVYKFVSISMDKLENRETEPVKSVFSDIENTFREEVRGRRKLVDLYGLWQKTIDHMVVGNFEFVADNGTLHMINDHQPWSADKFLGEMTKLKEEADAAGIPLVYVQAPNREMADNNATVTEFNIDNEMMDTVVWDLFCKGIPVLDIREELKTKEHDFPLSDLFFHTDMHMSTDAEIWMAARLAEFLEAQPWGIRFSNKEYLNDMSYFTKKSYEFLGNFGRTNGKYFVGLDTFDLYHPDFPTLYSFYIGGDEASAAQGSYEGAVMNDFESKPIDDYTYWVMDYMHFSCPSYTYVNHNQDGPNILFITDSMAYRGIAHMSLTSHKTTILDPRFFNGEDYIRDELAKDYDVVVVLQETYLMGETFLQ